MKVLFAVNDEKDAESITRMYQKEYKEIVSSKTVYYFNAIIKELQKDKTYDRIVISEDLEMFSSDNYQAVDKFVFEKMDAISDEATNSDGGDIPIILLCMDRRTKNDPLLVKLFGLGIYNCLVGQDRSVQKVVELINKPRNKKEAKLYYKVEAEKVSYSNDDSNEVVKESELQNILNHYKKIGDNIPKCVKSFDSIASQYSEEQLKVIVSILPNKVKVILEENSDNYRKFMGIKGKKVAGASELRKAEYVEKEIDTGSKLTQPVIIPTMVGTRKVTKMSQQDENAIKAIELEKKKQEELKEREKAKAEAEAKKKEKERIAREKAEAEAKRKEEERIAREKAEAEVKRKEEERIAREKAEAEAKRKEEERIAREKAEAEAKRKEEERIAREKAEAEAKKKEEERIAREKAEAEAKKKEEERIAREKAEAEAKKKEEERIAKEKAKAAAKKKEEEMARESENTGKRGRGRPRKNAVDVEEVDDVPVKRKRGRPRKNAIEENIENVGAIAVETEKNVKSKVKEEVSKVKDTAKPKIEEVKQEKEKAEKKIKDEIDDFDDILPGFDDLDENQKNEIDNFSDYEDEDLLPGFEDYEENSEGNEKNTANTDELEDDSDLLPEFEDYDEDEFDDYDEDEFEDYEDDIDDTENYEDDEFEDIEDVDDVDNFEDDEDNEVEEIEDEELEDFDDYEDYELEDDEDFDDYEDEELEDFEDYEDDEAEELKENNEDELQDEIEDDEEKFDDNDDNDDDLLPGFDDYEDEDEEDYNTENIAGFDDESTEKEQSDEDDDLLPGFDDDYEDEDENLDNEKFESDELDDIDFNDDDDFELDDNEDEFDNYEDDEDDILPGFEDTDDDMLSDLEDESKNQEGVNSGEEVEDDEDEEDDDILPGFDDDEDEDLGELEKSEKSEKSEESDEIDEDEFDFDDEDEMVEKHHDGSFKGITNKNYRYDNDLASSIKDLKETEKLEEYNFDTDNLITSGQKVVSFVGTSKNGTSFLVNNLAELFSNKGIKTAILDLTQNKNAYYIYTNNEDELREKAHVSFENLKNGIAEGVMVNNNLDVYTSLPGEDDNLDDVTNIMQTLLQNYTLVLLDCDFETDPRYFKTAQEIYLVQSLDVLTIQPLTAFLRELKVKNILEPNKLRIVINKNIKVGLLNEKVLIGGMSVYNDPAMTYMTELFNRDTIKYITIPFENQVYAKYLEGLVNCKISSKGYSKSFISSLNKLGDMVYPTINGKKQKNNYNNFSNQNNAFSKDTNTILDKMKKKY